MIGATGRSFTVLF